MHPTTRYHLEEYLKQRKQAEAEKPPREPSGFMKKHSSTKSTEQKPAKKAS